MLGTKCFLLLVIAASAFGSRAANYRRSIQQFKQPLVDTRGNADIRTTGITETTKYFVSYEFADSTCSESEIYEAYQEVMGVCLTGMVNGNASNIIYYKSMCTGAGYGTITYDTADCSDEGSGFDLLMPSAIMDMCIAGSIELNDDYFNGTTFGDDDSSSEGWVYTCTDDEIGYGLDTSPVVVQYADDNCQTSILLAYFKDDGCMAVGNSSATVTCDADLIFTSYEELSCTGNSTVSTIPTNTCLVGDLDDDVDDEYAYYGGEVDDSITFEIDFIVGSTQAMCTLSPTTIAPTVAPSSAPTAAPSSVPTAAPSSVPTAAPTPSHDNDDAASHLITSQAALVILLATAMAMVMGY